MVVMFRQLQLVLDGTDSNITGVDSSISGSGITTITSTWRYGAGLDGYAELLVVQEVVVICW
jgi:hypothetical protein